LGIHAFKAITRNPLFPASGLATGSLNGLNPKSKFLAIRLSRGGGGRVLVNSDAEQKQGRRREDRFLQGGHGKQRGRGEQGGSG